MTNETNSPTALEPDAADSDHFTPKLTPAEFIRKLHKLWEIYGKEDFPPRDQPMTEMRDPFAFLDVGT